MTNDSVSCYTYTVLKPILKRIIDPMKFENSNATTITRSQQQSILATHSVLRNTYFLLSLTLLFSAITAAFSMSIGAKPNFLLFLGGMFGLYFLVTALRNSAWGILAAF